VRVILDPDLTSVYWPLEEGRCRWGFQIQDATEHEASMARLEQLVAARAPWWTARPTQVYWSTLGLFQSRVARSFGRGGIWLAGDAAHQAAPVGVRSMNSGLAEARELASRMAGILRRGGAPSLLEEFATQTHEAWHALLGATAPGSTPGSTPAGGDVHALPGADPWVRQTGARILSCVPATGDDLEPLLEQIGLTIGLRA
jgi:2-polyprenyl-6-methoxyphenol hydroxylase-like FAD-dependent oxidoreductase